MDFQMDFLSIYIFQIFYYQEFNNKSKILMQRLILFLLIINILIVKNKRR